MMDTKSLQSLYTANDAMGYTTELIEKRKAESALVLRSGIPTMDRFVQPWLPGEQIIILAQTSHGKTAMLQAMARNIVKQIEQREDSKQVVVYASWETLVEELAVYDLAQSTGLSGTSLWYGTYDALDGSAIREAGMKLATRPLWYIGHSLKRRRGGQGMTIKALSETFRAMELEYGVTPAVIFIDYMQLITPMDGRQDRRLQVMANVDALRDLGRDTGAPVVIACQAGRHVSERQDKLPEVGDGQECVAGDTLIMDAATGLVLSVAEWHDRGIAPTVHSKKGWRLRPAPAQWLKQSGVRPLLRITTRGGRTIRVTDNHPFFREYEYVCAGDLRVGDWVAVARTLALAPISGGISEDRAEFLGLMLGDGSYTTGASPSYMCGRDVALGEYIGSIATREWGVRADLKEHSKYKGNYQIYFAGPVNVGPGKNDLINWLREIGVHGQLHDNATVPEVVQTASLRCVRAFLRGYATADGSFPKPRRWQSDVRVYFSSVSRLMLEQVRHLLLRCGFSSSLRAVGRKNATAQVIYNLCITGRDNVARYMDQIGFSPSAKAERIQGIYEQARATWTDTLRDPDMWPPSVCLRAIEGTNQYGKDTGHGKRVVLNMVKGRAISSVRLAHVGREIGDAEMVAMGEGDIAWDRIKSIGADGPEMTYDISVPDGHSFVASGFVTHNTSRIEQDADKVLSMFYPIKTEQDGSVLPVYNITVTPNLMMVRVCKQRRAVSGDVFPLHFDPTRNTFTTWRDEDTSPVPVAEEEELPW